MTRYTLHVPEYLNDGTPVPPVQLDEVEEQLLAIAGGFTLTRAVGAWRSVDRDYREPIRLYAVDAEDDAQGALVALAENIAGAFDQEAVYLTTTDIGQHFVVAA